jgi:hypothetical protein
VFRGLSPPRENPQALPVSFVLLGELFTCSILKPDKLPFTPYEADKTANQIKQQKRETSAGRNFPGLAHPNTCRHWTQEPLGLRTLPCRGEDLGSKPPS